MWFDITKHKELSQVQINLMNYTHIHKIKILTEHNLTKKINTLKGTPTRQFSYGPFAAHFKSLSSIM